MSKPNKPKPDADPMAKARAEACEIFKLDPERLTAADELRITLFCTLRLAVDCEAAKAATASGVDLGKINIATELIQKMLPTALVPPADDRLSRFKGDPAERLVQIVVGAIQAIDPSGQPVPLDTELDRLKRENEALRAMLGAPAQTGQVKLLAPPTDAPMPEDVDETPAGNPAPNAGNPAPHAAATPPNASNDSLADQVAELRRDPSKIAGKVWIGPNGERWQEPGPNQPPQARPGWLTRMLHDCEPHLPADVFQTRGVDSKGGSSGLRVDAYPRSDNAFGGPGFYFTGNRGRSW
jgi:hypothetical protein